MSDEQQLLFGEPEEPGGTGDKITSVAEVFDLVHKVLAAKIAAKVELPEPPAFVMRARERRAQKAAEVGLTARWSRQVGYVSIHNPTTGEWHDLVTKDAPSWAKWEASKRKSLYRSGDRCAYDLTSSQMEEIWQRERPLLDEEGIVEEYKLPDD
jgi:hypothetical protein